MRFASRIFALGVMVFLASAVIAQADVLNLGGTISGGTWTGDASLSFVNVGDAGNVADSTGYGAVPYDYSMGKYDVTMAQYAVFLNAVAKTDTYGLYNSNMGSAYPTEGIRQSGSPGSYSYSVTGSNPQAANCPLANVSWGDATRFCNWLQNGQPTSGTEGTGTTETGAYTLNGDVLTLTESRNAGATYFIPSENEWYKAAYYSGGGTNSAYYSYATKSNTPPGNTLPDLSGNNANFYLTGPTDSTNYLTPVGAFANSPGPYGTFDMGGLENQWNEAVIGSSRGMRGGMWGFGSGYMSSSLRNYADPTTVAAYPNFIGFRVASSVAVPEPCSLTLLLACALGFGIWRQRRNV